MNYPAATHYVDPAAVAGNNDGTSWQHAWIDAQDWFDNLVAGNACYARGTQVLTVSLDADGAAGTSALPVWLIGCDAAGTPGAGQFTIDGNGAVANNLITSKSWYFWASLRVTNATTYGVDNLAVQHYYHRFYGCRFDNNGSYGLYQLYSRVKMIYEDCMFDNNAEGAILSAVSEVDLRRCIFRDNGTWGIAYYYGGLIENCIFDETGTGINIQSAPAIVRGNVFYGGSPAAGTGIRQAGSQVLRCYGNVFHSLTTALDLNDEDVAKTDHNVLYGCTSNGTADLEDTDVEDPADDPLTDPANDDFSRVAGTDILRLPVTMPDGSNLDHVTAGLAPVALGGKPAIRGVSRRVG